MTIKKSLFIYMLPLLLIGCANPVNDLEQALASDLSGTNSLEGQYIGFMQTVDGQNPPWDLDHEVDVERISDGRLRISSNIIGEFKVLAGCLVQQVCVNIDMINITDILEPNLSVIEVKQVVFTRQDSGGWNLVIQYTSVDTQDSTNIQTNQFVSTDQFFN